MSGHGSRPALLIVTVEQAPYTHRGDATRSVPDTVPVRAGDLAGHRLGHAP
ncbi:hypothetical protein [Streptomyces sp. bgisy029]|uniref:hypothetical protein n=1 Tax=Streptomyces sp. bgisy029 TaxID=3413771 RepID=UPI003D72CC26